jgi:hypothetical protein
VLKEKWGLFVENLVFFGWLCSTFGVFWKIILKFWCFLEDYTQILVFFGRLHSNFVILLINDCMDTNYCGFLGWLRGQETTIIKFCCFLEDYTQILVFFGR